MIGSGLLVAQLWLAHGGLPAGQAMDDFDPRMAQDLVGLEDVDFDSGWVPADSPVQLRFYAHAADSIVIEMIGDGTYDWNDETIGFLGAEQGGHFLLDVGLQLEASVRFNVAGLQWESDILGPWDYAITSDAQFTPYLLPGHPESPVIIDDHTDGATVASVPIVPDIILASGNLDIDVAADVTASLAGVRIEASHAGDAAIVDAHEVPSPLSPEPGADPMEVEGVMVARLQTAPVLIVRPHLVMSIVGVEYEIVGIDIPIALPETDDELVFDPETMLFDAPAPAPGDGGVDESGEGGGSGAGDDPSPDDPTGTAGTGDTEGGSGGSAACCDDDASGCGCHSHGSAPGTAFAPLLLALGLLRRRRSRVAA